MTHRLIFSEADGNGVAIFDGDAPIPRVGEFARVADADWQVAQVAYEYPPSDRSSDPTQVRVQLKKVKQKTGEGWFM